MGAEDKNVKKPTVSNAVVKKKPSNGQTSEKSDTNNNKSVAAKSGTGRSGNSTGRSSSARRSSAGKSGNTARSSAGRSGNTARSSTGRSGSTARSSTGKNGNIVRNTVGKKKKRRGITPNQFILILSVVVGIVLVIIISVIMQNRYLKTTQTENRYVLGQPFDIKSYVSPSNDKATVELENADFQPEEVGTCDVEYIVRCGKLKKKKTVTVEVVDEEPPVIDGPDTLGVFLDENVSLLDYYTVEDAEPDLVKKLSIDKEVDTSQAGSTEYTLYVTDWSNNTTRKTVKLVVCSYEGDRKTAALAVRAFNQENGYAVTQEGVYVYQPDNMENTYVLIGEDLYKVKEDKVSKADADEDLTATIKANGEWIRTSELEYFNYNSET